MVDNYSAYIPVDLAKRLRRLGMPMVDDETPTYGEVFDWFTTDRYVVITLEPFHTFALQGHIGYTWKITYPDYDSGGLVIRTEDDEWNSNKAFGGSFKLTANDAIESAMTITVDVSKFME